MLVALWVCPSESSAQGSYQPYPVGSRAIGLGGAYTALADDAAGAYYNPAGIAFARRNFVSVTSTLYTFVIGSYAAALGGSRNFDFNAFAVIPTATGSLTHIGRPSGNSLPRLVFAFNVFSPMNYSMKTRVEQVTPTHSTLLSFGNLDSIQFFVSTLAYRFTERLSVGLSIYGTLHSRTVQTDIVDAQVAGPAGRGSYLVSSERTDQFNMGMMFALGVRYQVQRLVSIGLSVRSPLWHQFGFGHEVQNTLLSTDSALPTPIRFVNEDTQTVRILPIRIGAGVALCVPGRWALTADLVVYGPMEYTSTIASTRPELTRVIERRATVDVAFGAEYFLTPAVPLRTGFFTDRSTVRAPTQDAGDEQMDLYGFTLTVGRVTPRASTQFGLVTVYAVGKVLGLDLTSPGYAPVLASASEWRFSVVYSTSFTF